MAARVLLVSMPFALLDRPAIGISLLKSALTEAGFECDIAYANLHFARAVGRLNYERISSGISYLSLAGEWVFSESLFDTDTTRDYIARVLAPTEGTADIEATLVAHAASQRFLRMMLDAEPWPEYDVIGFTSSGPQNCASLALARLVRDRYPSTKIVFGGANCRGPMAVELLRQFPFVDAAFTTEGEDSFPAFLRYLNGSEPQPPEGVAIRKGGRVWLSRRSPPRPDLERAPIPDYRDYYSALSDTCYDREFRPVLPAEGSRGCWWGSCRFCALKGTTCEYRQKSPERLIDDLRAISRHQPASEIMLVDNLVSEDFLSVVLPELAREPLPLPLFFEVRADIDPEVVRLAKCLKSTFQPGIESFSDHVLALMGKGTTSAQNVELLARCREHDVEPLWCLMYGYPGEARSDYDEMLDLLPSLHSFTPPVGVGLMSLQRFSHLFANPSGYGLSNIRPIPVYSYVYPFPRPVLERIATFFDFDYQSTFDASTCIQELDQAIATWRTAYAENTVTSANHPVVPT